MLGGTSTKHHPVDWQIAWSAPVFVAEGVKGRAEIRIDHERAEFGPSVVYANAYEPTFGDACPVAPLPSGNGRGQSAQSGGWTRIIHKCPSGSSTWAAKAFQSCCAGS